jgi:hypothetical protein
MDGMSADEHDEPDVASLGEVPEGLGADLYPKHLEYLSRHEAFGDAVLSIPDGAGGRQSVELDQVTDASAPDAGSDRGRIRLRNGVILLASGAVIAGAIAAVRYRRRHKG